MTVVINTPTLLSDVLCNIKQMTKDVLVSLSCLAQASEAVAVLGDHKEVDWGLRRDITEGQCLIVFVNDVSWNLLANDFVENCRRLSVGKAAKQID